MLHRLFKNEFYSYLECMKILALTRKQVFYIIPSVFIILVLVQLVLLNNAYTGKEKDFNDRLFYVVRSFNQEVVKDFIDPLPTDSSTIVFAQTFLAKRIDSVFKTNDIPADFVYAVTKNKNLPGWAIQPNDSLSWSSDTRYNEGLSTTRLRLGPFGAAGEYNFFVKIFLPSKPAYLWLSLLPLVLILTLTLLILLFCFMAMLAIIKKQATIAEIKNDFVNNMTHELKTPLFTISIASKMLAEQPGIKENNKYISYVQSIQQETDRLTKLVDKVLQTSSLERKQLQLDKKEIDLHAAIRSAVDNLELIRQEQKATIELYLEADQHMIYADETHIQSVIYSLADNAFKYSNGPAHITISSRNVDNGIIVWIADKGIGFDAATKQQVFERFFRAHTGNLHDVKGYGIGLSYVKSIIEAHGGTISVESKPGKGSEFIIILPCTPHAK